MEWSVCCNARWRDMSRGRSQFCLRKLIDCDLSVLVQEARETRSVVVKMLHTNYTNRSVYFVSLFVSPPPQYADMGGEGCASPYTPCGPARLRLVMVQPRCPLWRQRPSKLHTYIEVKVTVCGHVIMWSRDVQLGPIFLWYWWNCRWLDGVLRLSPWTRRKFPSNLPQVHQEGAVALSEHYQKCWLLGGGVCQCNTWYDCCSKDPSQDAS